MPDYAVIDNGKRIAIIYEDNWCYAALGKNPLNEACGGCQGCVMMQSEHWGYDVVEIKTMHDYYDDGSDHQICPVCQMCLTCNDCKCDKGDDE